jgi:hypothetical protein
LSNDSRSVRYGVPHNLLNQKLKPSLQFTPKVLQIMRPAVKARSEEFSLLDANNKSIIRHHKVIESNCPRTGTWLPPEQGF